MTQRRQTVRAIRKQAERGFAIFGVLVLVYLVFFRVDRVCSDSMAPTLCGTCWDDGELVLTETLVSNLLPIRRWSLITFRTPSGDTVSKRVVAFAGEEVECRDEWIWIDGERLPRPAELSEQRYFAVAKIAKGRKHVVKAGYFVLGDNNIDSLDSRFEPPVREDQIIGRPIAILWPFKRLRWL